MYVPEHFAEHDTAYLQALIREHGFGTLVIADADGIEANHVPFHLDTPAERPLGVLECHLARNNDAWRRIEAGADLLALFEGPHAYVSPSWYPTKAETGRVVPTWNYLVAHVTGSARVLHDPEWLLAHVGRLTDQHEAGREAPWSVSDAPAEYTAKLAQAIVGLEITVERIVGKRKASQNQPQRNRRGVIDGLLREGTEAARAAAALTTE